MTPKWVLSLFPVNIMPLDARETSSLLHLVQGREREA